MRRFSLGVGGRAALQRGLQVRGGAFAWRRIGRSGEGAAEFAGGEGVAGSEAGGEQARAVLASVDGFAECAVLQEIDLLEGQRATDSPAARAEDRAARISPGKRTSTTWPVFVRSTVAERHDPRDALSLAGGVAGETHAPSEPRNGEAQAELALQATVAEEMGIGGAVDDGKGETRRKHVFELFPHNFLIGLLMFHDLDPVRKEYRRWCRADRP
jgi:hypothetical protein